MTQVPLAGLSHVLQAEDIRKHERNKRPDELIMEHARTTLEPIPLFREREIQNGNPSERGRHARIPTLLRMRQ
jgi:hypothetical protein